jgi:serine/threonine-protein kinase RsbW
MANSTSVKLVISSEIKLVDLVHAAAEQMAGLAGFDADESLNVGLAVREAVINAIVHGNKQNPALKVNIALVAGSHGLEVRIRDHGAGFDPDSRPNPTADPNLLNTSGRGLLLIRAFVDDVDVQHRERGTEVTLIKRCKRTKAN